jgi:hypothetical protein
VEKEEDEDCESKTEKEKDEEKEEKQEENLPGCLLHSISKFSWVSSRQR